MASRNRIHLAYCHFILSYVHSHDCRSISYSWHPRATTLQIFSQSHSCAPRIFESHRDNLRLSSGSRQMTAHLVLVFVLIYIARQVVFSRSMFVHQHIACTLEFNPLCSRTGIELNLQSFSDALRSLCSPTGSNIFRPQDIVLLSSLHGS